jgi:AraC family transcriptional regulator, regulatory protein of adaptative response / methylated-DNA-[protein]-cysteine methyltransferase
MDMQSVEQWQLVLERNPLAEGQFVYAVRSTGIYCKPTCPSRRPRFTQVEFFKTPQEAETAGYRSCKRCSPASISRQAQAVISACDYLAKAADRRVSLEELAEHVQMSAFHFQRLFKKETGVSPREYQATLRAGTVRKQLAKGSSVTDSIYEAGYGSNSRYYERAGRELGMSPSAWRKGGRGISVRHTVFHSPLGQVLIAATEKGVCFLALGDNEQSVVSQLRAELPEADIRRDDDALETYKQTVFEYLTGKSVYPDLPLDVQATAFQSRVWKQLRSIEPGQTRTYSDIALELGDENLTRAVARACATNPVSLAIPCHRVVRTGGALAGYRWGLNRKRRLLDLEQGVK